MADNFERGALTEATYFILLSLTSPKHGYGIMQFIKEISNDRLNIGAGTLYGALNTLLEKQLIIPVSNDENSRKKEYILSEIGKQTLLFEIERLEELIYTGKKIIKEANICY